MLSHIIAPWLARRGIHYGWLVMTVTFLTMLATSACMGLPGVLIVPLRLEFGWDTGAISAALGLRLALYGLLGVFAAALMQRYGVRTVICAALVLLMTGLGLATTMTALWHLWVTWGLLVGVATGMTAMVLAATVANRWFTARRGLVLGMLAASTATGQLLFLPAAAWLASTFGWRMAVLPGFAACGVCFVLVLLTMRDHPGELGLAPYGETAVIPPPPRAGAGVARLSLAALVDASGSRAFWLLFLTFFICGLSTNGIVQNHFIPLCFDYGMPEVEAASVLAIMGVFDFVGTIGSGWLSDRYDSRWLLFWYYAGRGISLVVLPFSTFSIYGLSVFAVFFGLDFIATVPPTVRLTAREFGRERAALVFGWIFAAHQMGAAVAAWGGGASRDALASYLPAFFVAGLACFIAAAASLAIRRARLSLSPAIDGKPAIFEHDT
jgi:predicted MFS family arabinose efflux permease